MLPTSSCLDCKSHAVIADPDPNDSFCDDDCAVVCMATKNDRMDKMSEHLAEHSPFKSITVGCRPYNLRKESVIPSWCPLKDQ